MKIINFLSLAVLLLFSNGLLSAQEANQDNQYFDQAVKPDLYLVRPGDKIDVVFINSKLAPLGLRVNPEVKIIDQTLGIFDLTGKTLSETKAMLKDKLTALYNVSEFVIAISEPRQVTVSISGAINRPGIYTGYTSDRVSDIINKAGGIAEDGSMRWITFNGGPNNLTVDLDRAVYLNDYDANPCLYAGYAIYVPSKSENVVTVAGEVNHPRGIELVENDTIDDLILFAGGVRSVADRSKIKIVSKNSESGKGALKSGDIIMVPARERTAFDKKIAIFGAVLTPGFYEYSENKTLSHIVEKAGGYLSDANKELTTIYRKPRVDINGRVTDRRFPISNLFDSESINKEPILLPEDSIYVPVNVGFITVSGAVYNPGYFPYQQGQDVMFFIKKAGGFLPTANTDKVSIFNPVSKITSMVSPRVLVNDGTEIIVNVREELK